MTGGIIYLVTCRATGKNYVGQTTRSLDRRWTQHLASARRGSTYPLHAAIRKYGPQAFVCRVVEVVRERSGLNTREAHFTDAYRALSPYGYNLKAGDGRESKFAPEALAKMSRASRANQTPARRRLTSEWMKLRWANRQLRTEYLVVILPRLHSPDVEMRRSETQRRVQRVAMNRPEVREKLSAAQRATWSKPNVGRRRALGIERMWDRPGHREAHAAAIKRAVNAPGFQARRVASAKANRGGDGSRRP